ncbi:MAG: fatty acid desaturase [Pirellulales bacterium]
MAWKPSNGWGLVYSGIALATTGLGVGMSLSSWTSLWLIGQLVLAFCYLLWFSLVHEAGHRTLFRSRAANTVIGHLSGFLAFLPFSTWQPIHRLHHRWTGWQDLDPTTAVLTPRPRSQLQRGAVTVCWFLWLPLFSILYRAGNYWNLPRLWRLFPDVGTRWRMTLCVLLYAGGYAAIGWWAGWALVGRTTGVALLATLIMQDLLILSQHTHIPMPVSEGEAVRPVPAALQEQYTRSLVFPRWFSRWVLVGFDAHELHHAQPRIPGYYLHEIARPTANAMPWWLWVWRARRIRGDVLLFQNRDQTGLPI